MTLSGVGHQKSGRPERAAPETGEVRPRADVMKRSWRVMETEAQGELVACDLNFSNRLVRTCMPTGVRGVGQPRWPPLSRLSKTQINWYGVPNRQKSRSEHSTNSVGEMC